MVHALGEIRRVLNPDGVLIDLRPVFDRWPIEVVSAHEPREVRATGRMQDFPAGPADDEAANRVFQKSAPGKPGFGPAIKGTLPDVAMTHLCPK